MVLKTIILDINSLKHLNNFELKNNLNDLLSSEIDTKNNKINILSPLVMNNGNVIIFVDYEPKDEIKKIRNETVIKYKEARAKYKL